ncbi:MAG TPA: hypothetical protein VGS27_05910 [Candidatus Sulfotelmatobacter sp.]|nr:hypothetical protein [Candidatus Sulfotelmatobacter sp.]
MATVPALLVQSPVSAGIWEAVTLVLVVMHVEQVMLPVVLEIESGALEVTAGVPLLVPKVIVGLPATACGVRVTFPLVVPTNEIWPVDPLAPTVSNGETNFSVEGQVS